jgi:hypothetical protein
MLRSKASEVCRRLGPLRSSVPAAAGISSSSILAAGDALDPAQSPKQQKVCFMFAVNGYGAIHFPYFLA